MDAEIEPSADLWNNIKQELEPKRKRVFPIYWVAAACVLIAVTGLILTQEKRTIRLHGKAQVLAKTEDANTIVKEDLQMPETAVKTDYREPVAKTNFHLASNKQQSDEMIKNIQTDLQPKENIERLPVKPLDVMPYDVTKSETTVTIANVGNTNPVNQEMIAQVDHKTQSADLTEEVESTQSKKGFRNVGDVVNYVIDKVDKREKKLIRFSTDDDDNSSIIGINIGFVKLNSKKNKQNN
ncbi:hypothetical protein [Pedobacter montanisoli]|uniref:Uncharacterized protein n=1 Tax=Pedobacter montanisoli TaxID=2923277 RepID=A0ABS9ZWW8_9SPHI|nr:hypothetical protein [Pedobacter montanisoli]MCJ0742793.1 hypothetical protein [Pedobacter montanisoli]